MYKRALSLALLLILLLSLAPARAADYPLVQFGEYQYDKDGGAAPIRWLLLKDDAAGVLLLSELVLEAKAVHREGRYNGYEYSQLKQWLAGDFFQAAFSPGEQALVTLAEGQPAVTLPSVEELRQKDGGYFNEEGVRAKATPYAIALGVQRYSSGDSSYWTRNPSISTQGNQRRVIDKGSFGHSPAYYENIGVRPLLLLLPGALEGKAGLGTAESPYQLSLPEIAAETPEAPAEEASPELTEETAAEAAPETQAPGSPDVPQAPAASSGALLTEGFPALNAQGFLNPGEAPYIFKDEENGVWRYASQTLRLVINRRQDTANKLRWFETNIFFAPGESLRMYPFDENNRRRMSPMDKIADLHNLVYALNGDYYIYRVNRDREADYTVTVGRVARAGKLLYDQEVSKNRKAHPNLDLMALYPDGRMTVHGANETTAQALLDAGAFDVLSFGPFLVRDGMINTQGVSNFGVTQQPRAALGMVGEGHFLHVVMESRTSKSKGVNTTWMAEKMLELGCHTAFNLDGGQTAVLIFLGEQLNEIGKYDNKTNSREQNEVMGIGTR